MVKCMKFSQSVLRKSEMSKSGSPPRAPVSQCSSGLLSELSKVEELSCENIEASLPYICSLPIWSSCRVVLSSGNAWLVVNEYEHAKDLL